MSKPLLEIFHEMNKGGVGVKGIRLPHMVVDAGAGLELHALDLPPEDVYKHVARVLISKRPRELVFGMDRWVRPGQGVTTSDLLSVHHWHADAGWRFGIIPYRLEPPIWAPIDWTNLYFRDGFIREMASALARNQQRSTPATFAGDGAAPSPGLERYREISYGAELMTLNEIVLAKPEARAQAIAYRNAIESGNAHSGDEEILAGLRALARGKVVIDLITTFADSGVDQLSRPLLAVARADATFCFFDHDSRGGGTFASAFNGDSTPWRKRSASLKFELPRLTWPPINPNYAKRLRAVVPSIPPQCRPPGPLERYHILWEAEWVTVPKDPFLLRHLRGSLYAVVARWDLTPIEMAVLRGRLR